MLAVAVHVPAEESNKSAVATLTAVGCVPLIPPATSTRPSGSNIGFSFAVVVLGLVGAHVWLTGSYDSALLNQWYGQQVLPPTISTEPSGNVVAGERSQTLAIVMLPVSDQSPVLGSYSSTLSRTGVHPAH